jgi:hypothetical protein
MGFNLEMEVICSSETSVPIRTTWQHILEDNILQSHRSENLKSYKEYFMIEYPYMTYRLSNIVDLFCSKSGGGGG